MDELLARHLPVWRYDSQEQYFADSAAEWTDNPGHELRRADGTVLATATRTPGQAQLSLAFLRAGTYPDGTAVRRTDRIADPAHDYAAQARALHARPQYANRTYGHVATGGDGRTWLAYWSFYFFNDYNLVGHLLPAGLHEGDWEMVQVRLDAAGEAPDLAVYAQHTGAEQRPWDAVERVGERPVVYPARGSHASYFTAGTHWTGHWFDHADGARATPDLALEVVRDGDPAHHWVAWPGMWGDTEPRGAGLLHLLDDSSPRGPGGHPQWHDPTALLAKVHGAPTAPAPPVPAAPRVALDRGDNGRLSVAYTTTTADPAALVVTVNSPDDRQPPRSQQVAIAAPDGVATVDAGLRAEQAYDVHVSVATAAGLASPSAAALLPRAR